MRVDAIVPDPRVVLPIDVITEMIRQEPLVALTDCACRKAKQVLGKGCEHPLQTCLAFNKYAQALMRSGIAHQIDHEKAISIVRQGEELGLVHNVSNCQEHIEFICNCCPCSCGLMASLRRGQTNALAPSRYVVAVDGDRCTLCQTCVEICPVNAVHVVDGKITFEYERCIGCGLCVSACPVGARRMELREMAPDIPSDSRALNERITSEAMAAIASH
jgi:formate hydrogenlyase subunit 6/NADH:ubiquinone oxidoreductase subunit I